MANEIIDRPSSGNDYPLLSSIDSPEDLRRLPVSQLPEVCDEMRRFLIASLSKNPGHFASSMGAVELTVALHYVFNTPRDRIVWDVGHQAYGHKILTGRRDRFATNRQWGGLSGFPNPDESEYDTFTAGHASNSISAALGMAVASALSGETPRRNVVAVIGDASISGGLAFEGLNNAANANADLLIILNDNDMSIDRNVGSLNSYLAHMTTSKKYNDFRFKLFNLLKRLHLVTDKAKGKIMRFNNSLKSLITNEQNIFEGLNIRYFGPFDGHDMTTLVNVLTDIKDMRGPRILHLRTVKGKGYAPAEEDPTHWHAPGIFNPTTGERITSSGSNPKYQDVFGQTLVNLARTDKHIVGITAAMLSGTSMIMMQKAFPERTFDVGISEGHAVTFAGGLAKEGMKPFVAIYSSFLQRAYDHIIHDVAIQRLPVVLCIDRAGIVGEDGVTHHGAFDLAYMRSIPGMTVSAPRDPQYLSRLMLTAARYTDGPMSIRYPRGSGYNLEPEAEITPLPIGKGERLADGNDVTILSIGTVAADVIKAIDLTIEKHPSASIAHYDMIFLNPLDEDLLREVAAKGAPVITVEDGTVKGGLGAAVMEWFAANGVSLPVITLGIPDKFIAHGSVSQLKAFCGFDADGIAAAIESIINLKHSGR
ncbi:MAG: 1-deoxy-D-xylulose-5-phosphate synthase [Lachnoclostridium sp.]|nr:1-deoxy-D-xylulose-5-phosphate synthase [Lachnoclostridium sp.]